MEPFECVECDATTFFINTDEELEVVQAVCTQCGVPCSLGRYPTEEEEERYFRNDIDFTSCGQEN